MSSYKQAQEAILGAILVDSKNVMPLVADKLTAENFINPECERVFAACLSLFQEQKHIDVITVLDRLGDDTYKPYLVQLVESLPSVRGLSEYIRIVSEESRRANAVSRLNVALTRLQSGEPLEDVQNAVALTAQSMSGHEGSSVSAADGFLLVADSLGKPRQYIGTGFRKLDSLLFIAPGDFVVIGARPSVGKTAFSLQMALHMARAKKVIYFSCETSAPKIYERALACYGNLSFRQIKQGGQIPKDKLEMLKDGFSSLRLSVVEAAGWTVPEIQAKAIQERAEVVFIDYLTLLSAEGKSLYEKATNASKGLHTMAQQNKIAVVALSQLNRAGDGEPTMVNLRESGQIEQDADAILFLHRSATGEDTDDQERKLIISKNKEGQCGYIKFRFDGDMQRFFAVGEPEEGSAPPF